MGGEKVLASTCTGGLQSEFNFCLENSVDRGDLTKRKRSSDNGCVSKTFALQGEGDNHTKEGKDL